MTKVLMIILIQFGGGYAGNPYRETVVKHEVTMDTCVNAQEQLSDVLIEELQDFRGVNVQCLPLF